MVTNIEAVVSTC